MEEPSDVELPWRVLTLDWSDAIAGPSVPAPTRPAMAPFVDGSHAPFAELANELVLAVDERERRRVRLQRKPPLHSTQHGYP
jgi:hypothetical protein